MILPLRPAVRFLALCGLTGLLSVTGKAEVPALVLPVQSFNKSNPPATVEETLRRADLLRDEAVRGTLLLNWAMALQMSDEAKLYYNYVLDELEPHNAYAALNLGFLPMVLSRIAPAKERDILRSQARAKLTEADNKRKGYADAHRYLGELSALEGDWTKAIAEFSQLVGSRSEDSHLHALWGYALWKCGRKDEARTHFRQAVEKGSPEQCAAWAKVQL